MITAASYMDKTWIALIPAYQPEFHLIDLLKEIKKRGIKAVVVNDGDENNNKEIFDEAAKYAVVLQHHENRGKGRALKTGLEYIDSHYREGYVVVTMDADGQHTVTDAEHICELAEAEPDTLVLGSRGFDKDVPIRSQFGNTVTRAVYSIATGTKVHDTQTGLRAFSSKLVPEFLKVQGERYEYEMNVLLECSRRNIPIEEADIETIYIDDNASSHFDTVKDSFLIYKEIIKFSASSFVGFLVDYAMFLVLSWVMVSSGLLGIEAAMGIALANVGARLVSAAVNYNINRKIVFDSDVSVGRSAPRYFSLAALILAMNTMILSLLTGIIGINHYVAKIITEVLCFAISWLVQRNFVFKSGPDSKR